MLKKLLILLGTTSIMAASVTVVGFSFANKTLASIEAKVRNYINISSTVARGAIVGQKKDARDGNGAGIALSYAGSYMNGQKLGDVVDGDLGNLKDIKVSQLLSTMFNEVNVAKNPYTVANWGSFNNHVDPDVGLNLEKDGEKIDVNKGITGKSSFADTFGLITGVLSMLLSIDFDGGANAPLIESLLSTSLVSGPIKGMMGDETVGSSILEKLDPIIKGGLTGKTLFQQLKDAMSEDDLTNPETLKFGEVFVIRTKQFWQGLAEILFSGTKTFGPDQEKAKTEYDNWMTYVANKGAEAIFGTEDKINVAFNWMTIDGITKIIRYLRTLLVYVQEFQKLADKLPIDKIIDHNHLFSIDIDQTNGKVAANIWKEGLYINPSDVINNGSNQIKASSGYVRWTKTGNTYAQVINFQQVVGLLQNLLSYDKEDSKGFAMERVLFSTLFGNTLDKYKKKIGSAKTPFWDLIANPLLTELVKSLLGNYSWAWPILKGILDWDNTLYSIPMMLGSNFGFYDKVNTYTSTGSIKELIDKLFIDIPFGIGKPIALVLNLVFKDDPDKQKKAETLIENFKNEVDEDSKEELAKQKFGNIFKQLFDGNLIDQIAPIIEGIAGITIPKGLNIKKILSTPIDVILKKLGLNIFDDANFLYGLKEKTLTDLIDAVASEFEVVRNRRMLESQTYLLSLGTVNTLLDSLTTKVKFDGFKTDVTKNKFIIDNLNTHDWDIISGAMIGLAYGVGDVSKEVTVTLKPINAEPIKYQGKTIDGASIPTWILGVQKIEGKGMLNFREGSILDGLQKFYGHNSTENQIIKNGNKKSITKTVSAITYLSGWIANTSLVQYVEKNIAPYFKKELWTTQLIDYEGMDSPTLKGLIEYYLKYKNPDNGKITKYKVTLIKDAWESQASIQHNWTTNTPHWIISSIVRED
ncbi:MOLPALP family lipoprotein [Williamsoniiplasma luminosum]|uniref:MOLPALP family lipoprotein n=1 Tax=Williamsoniiplasma luminosum TaxID=214888 RepID=A0A2K8NUD0_9MOLU|nr:MOLPALP family lipoprotein [Williamsoniiplasma luminosum]ATZ17374.1 MOLPALP family lipoprotein [Williamsoniiplasma luminosum]